MRPLHRSALSAWWTRATGTGSTGGELRFWFDHTSPCVIRVDDASPARVCWTVAECDFLDEWVGTHPTFTITPSESGRLEIAFTHHGLTPQLDCIDMCSQGWNHFIPSLGHYLDTGVAEPFGSPQDRARRRSLPTPAPD